MGRKTKQRKRQEQRDRERAREGLAKLGIDPDCTCPFYGGFAEAVPDDEWLAGLKQRATCPVHGKKG